MTQPVHFGVRGPLQRMKLIVSSSRILKTDLRIKKVQVNNPEVVQVVPLSPTEVQVAALKTGVTQVNLWDEQGNIHSVDIVVSPDARELQLILQSEFPNSSLRVRPLQKKFLISGHVDRPEAVAKIVAMAEDYYPTVINNITVCGVQTVVLEVQIMEVSRTKLREMGFDWAQFSGSINAVSSLSGLVATALTAPIIKHPAPGIPSAPPLITPLVGGGALDGSGTLTVGITNGNDAFFGFLKALRANNLMKVLAEPKLTTISGRKATFEVGGELPVLVPQSLGTVTVDYKPFGTRLDFVPIVLDNGKMQLNIRTRVSEKDAANSIAVQGTVVSGIRTRWVETSVEMRAGQTLALAGLIQKRVEAQNRGTPYLSEIPWAGAAFRTVKETINEVELLIMVTPRLVAPMEPHQVPKCLPGRRTTSPSDTELYWRGYIEVPKCCPSELNGDPNNASNGWPANTTDGHPTQGFQPQPQRAQPNGQRFQTPQERPQEREQGTRRAYPPQATPRPQVPSQSQPTARSPLPTHSNRLRNPGTARTTEPYRPTRTTDTNRASRGPRTWRVSDQRGAAAASGNSAARRRLPSETAIPLRGARTFSPNRPAHIRQYTRSNQSNTPRRPSANRPQVSGGNPGLIGPVGNDVLHY